MMRAVVDLDATSLALALREAGLVGSHAVPLLRAFYAGAGEIDFPQLNVGPRVEGWLRRNVPLRRGNLRTCVGSADGTTKLLVGYADGGAVESVLMPSFRPDRAAGCVSSQIGCAMGCDFCASTRRGLERNLEAGEIIEQFLHLKAHAAGLGRRITSLVFMGMGEPMHNLDNVMIAIERIAHPQMGALGWRQITVSTVGIVPGIDRLADADLNVHLALSLHAPDDETRGRIVPSNRRYPVADIMAAARRFEAKTRRIPTIEYCMLAGVNDSDDHARMLCGLMSGFRAHVNLIPYNFSGAGLSGIVYRKPAEQRVGAFLEILRAGGVVAHRRVTRGDDVNAACGQLRETQFAG
ncbi:MAG TPA: 23S rRNA (adenine(2503)-C(2))-methyltransferase RlmN [Tepidisphaeraceae bacterium]|jgi:23S rRNA (adenine2503-C2)-methyltransferase|nr:23S rRNA (adenine(2503)-C(2))-methyltransferase RlmN [Tepidisphaeraceae bacterium]